MNADIDWTLVIAWLALAVSIAAAVVAWRVPHAVEDRRQRAVARELKIDCLRRVMGLRSVDPTPDWLSALNEACVVFSDAPPVLDALQAFATQIWVGGERANERLIGVIQAMLYDLQIDLGRLDEEYLLRPFGRPQL